MPLVAFIDPELINEIEKIDNKSGNKSIFPEHEFLLSCYKIGLNINDMKLLTAIIVAVALYLANNNIKFRKKV